MLILRCGNIYIANANVEVFLFFPHAALRNYIL